MMRSWPSDFRDLKLNFLRVHYYCSSLPDESKFTGVSFGEPSENFFAIHTSLFAFHIHFPWTKVSPSTICNINIYIYKNFKICFFLKLPFFCPSFFLSVGSTFNISNQFTHTSTTHYKLALIHVRRSSNFYSLFDQNTKKIMHLKPINFRVID